MVILMVKRSDSSEQTMAIFIIKTIWKETSNKLIGSQKSYADIERGVSS